MKQLDSLKLFVFSMAVLMIAGCATHGMHAGQGAFTPKMFKAGHYAPKVDNFMVIMDASSSMGEKGTTGHSKFSQAKTVLEHMNLTLPDLKVKGALRTFGHSSKLSRSRSELFYGPAEYKQAGFQEGLDKVKPAGGSTPMTAALDAAVQDLAATQGKIAVIVISDGLATDNSPVKAAEAMKAEFGDRLCIYGIHVGDNAAGRMVMDDIAKAGQCGFALNADDLMSADAMADFVEKVFLNIYVDTDGDGVFDCRDKCPGTPAGVKVDENGCPLDSDGDGVYDYMDKCPQTPKGVRVDKNGCPPDSDGDGVYDYKDKCPGTPAGAKVNADGCWVLGDVLFDFNKSVIKPTAYGLLDEVIQILKGNTGIKVSLDGHTDNIGKAAYNMTLSQKRAAAVVDYLTAKGIAAARLSSKGFGLTKPIATNDTDAGRSLNRRVEIRPVQ